MAVLRTCFPTMSRARLTDRAREHAIRLAFDRGYDTAGIDGIGAVSDERLVVNLLRNEYTDYNKDQSTVRHTAACDAIAAAFPFLADECQRQAAARQHAQHVEDAFWADYMAREQAYRTRREAFQHRRTADSHAVITAMSPGDRVELYASGNYYVGELTKVARSRVTVTYRLKNGTVKTKICYARDVTPAAADTSLGHVPTDAVDRDQRRARRAQAIDPVPVHPAYG